MGRALCKKGTSDDFAKKKDAQKSLNFRIQAHFFIINLDPFLFFSDFRDWDKKSVFSAIALLGV